MMNDMMGGGMMWGMSLAALIGAAVIVLVIAALLKYVSSAEVNVGAAGGLSPKRALTARSSAPILPLKQEKPRMMVAFALLPSPDSI
ncbi:hypothetical protein HFN72_33610 [Rhizobium laguerreae]|uniref:hypothetical protein n=1 Tax=Rhizobium laguerreae TaxID=1076926 RepID=UPI001C8FCD76|nr:hypothetical protein [Rhizobium laguerreae]MBY3530807.1 hypothetical protein [Rhizobium laguerreae]